ncbi:GNAT family N-acetyltransferase [Psychrobacter sp. FDAARGOS_221]|uniref:GNAT family N-acetyltransferase n=1 Tax=Psychrobacter sp. FDAARGOS_221 TaxID=1975705 RepID=UPI00187D26B7|nr:GNAT family N-acetyltransferase [Psychrobacter sp. FDAARGOS_221]
MSIRQMTLDDYEAVYQLWINTPNMGLNDVDDSKDGIARMLNRNPTLSFVAEVDHEQGKQIVGVIIAGEDGRRGYIYHTAVDVAYRNQGIGEALVNHVMDAMKALSISKVGLFIFQRNEIGNAFWERLGFGVRDDLYYRNKAVIELERIDT